MKRNFLKYLALALVLPMLITLGACAKKAPSVGDTLVLGPATVEVTRLDESTTSPVLGELPQSGMKFVLVELRITLQSGGEFDSALIFLENASGIQYGPPKVYGSSSSGDFEASSQKVSAAAGASAEFNLFFEVPQNESLDRLIKLIYR
jgi:hypothetical protein